MSDVFIAYKRQDRAHIEPIRRAFAHLGIRDWFDGYLDPHADWRPQVMRQIGVCKAMVVCWSEAACASAYVMEEAELGRARGVLVPVRLDACAIGAPFASLEACDLSNWSGALQAPAFQSLLRRITPLLTRHDPMRLSPPEYALAAQQQQ